MAIYHLVSTILYSLHSESDESDEEATAEDNEFIDDQEYSDDNVYNLECFDDDDGGESLNLPAMSSIHVSIYEGFTL